MISITRLSRAFNVVRDELREVGLLDDGVYLDQIELVRSPLPSIWTMGYCFHNGVTWLRLVGYQPGTIYIPINAPVERSSGYTLADVIRHEFGHAWAWLDRKRIDGPWFKRAFGERYGFPDGVPAPEEDFVSEYAMTRPAEDFADTFMTYLRHRRNLSRFKNQPGLYRKLRAIEVLVRDTRKHIQQRRRR